MPMTDSGCKIRVYQEIESDPGTDQTNTGLSDLSRNTDVAHESAYASWSNSRTTI